MDLNTILIILGLLALIALVAHGIWSNRRERSRYFQNANTFEAKQPRQPVAKPVSVPQQAQFQPEANPIEIFPEQQPLNFEAQTAQFESAQQELLQDEHSVEQQISHIKITLANEPEPFGVDRVASADTSPQFSYAEPQAESELSPVAEVAPQFARDADPFARKTENYKPAPTVSIPVENNEPTETREEFAEPRSAVNSAQNFVMLYVVAPENREFAGTNLVKALDDLGFIFGKQHIYHRHLDLTSSSPVLFSVANIQQPGTFDPYDMDSFFTVGVAIFMQLPSVGNDRANLKMMIRAARSLAEDLNGYVLTDQQEIFDEYAEQRYLNRVV